MYEQVPKRESDLPLVRPEACTAVSHSLFKDDFTKLVLANIFWTQDSKVVAEKARIKFALLLRIVQVKIEGFACH